MTVSGYSQFFGCRLACHVIKPIKKQLLTERCAIWYGYQNTPVLLNRSARTKHTRGRENWIDLSKFPPEKIRNFGIIAHVDHGKSTLADRLLEITGTIRKNANNKQVLDSLQVERERGITVKAQTASIIYKYAGEEYLLNLIDTPGHVDFSYEVSRSLSACQGVLLLVDATKGVQAQTLSNFYLAMERDIAIVPVINKIDLRTSNVKSVTVEMQKFFDFKPDEIIKISAKTGQNIKDVVEAIITRTPSPNQYHENCDPFGDLKALLFDSSYKNHKGVHANLAVMNGSIRVGDKVTSTFLKTSALSYEIKEVGILRPNFCSTGVLYAGQVGYMFCGMKSIAEAKIGDTFHHLGKDIEPFSDFKQIKPMVLGTFYPHEQSEYVSLKNSIDKLTLNDSSVSVEAANSLALGPGFRLGFLGLLHMDVFKQRLEQEYNASVISTTPTVPYKAVLSSPSAIKSYGSEEIVISTASDFPESFIVSRYLQPMVYGTIMAPSKYQDVISELCASRNGEEMEASYIDNKGVVLRYRLPLNEVIVDFYDKLKSITSGYGSFDYDDAGYQETKLVKVDILLNGKPVPELSSVFNEHKSLRMARQICKRLQASIPRQLFLITIQAVIGNSVVVSERISAIRKDVTAKCYGGDITRRMKLLRNQREGKKKMRQVGKVTVPKDAFVKVLQE